jgi:hypothetical protein
MRKFKINHISAVDRPAQEGAVMTIMKRDDPNPIVAQLAAINAQNRAMIRKLTEPPPAYEHLDEFLKFRAFGRARGFMKGLAMDNVSFCKSAETEGSFRKGYGR